MTCLGTFRTGVAEDSGIRAETEAVGLLTDLRLRRSSARMQSKRRWRPGWQRAELVALCLDRGMSRREAASYRHVSVATVQYWIGRLPDRERGRAGVARPRERGHEDVERGGAREALPESGFALFRPRFGRDVALTGRARCALGHVLAGPRPVASRARAGWLARALPAAPGDPG